MILPIVPYGHPVLRQKGGKVSEVTPEIRQLAADMIETMHEANGVGLAAQQVGRALQLTVLDVRTTDRASQLFMGVREVNIESAMPMILLNPVVLSPEKPEMGEEGCLSFPGVTGDVERAHSIRVSATNLEGEPLQFTATGLLGRAIQHEVDHLNGVLFIDRMTPEERTPLEPKIRVIEKETLEVLKKKRKARGR